MTNAKTRRLPHALKRRLQRVPRKKWHPIIHKVRKKYKISRRTIYYLKEYGPKNHVARVIIKESMRILILASILSSVGGIGLQSVQLMVVAIMPLLVMLPALTDMIGDFGTIVSSRFAVMLYLGQIHRKNWWRSLRIRRLFRIIMVIAIISAMYLGAVAVWISIAQGFAVTAALFLRIMEIALLATIMLVCIIFLVSVLGGFYIFSKKEDPNNFMIPITTSIADFGSLLIFSLLVGLLF